MFVNGLTTYFDQAITAPKPLDPDLRLIWKQPESKYDLFSGTYHEILCFRSMIVSMILYLNYISQSKEVNALHSLFTNKIWKNSEMICKSLLFLAFNSAEENIHLEVCRLIYFY